MKSLRYYIDANWVEPKAVEVHETYNPSTGDSLATVPYARKDQVEDAIVSANRAFESWSNLAMTTRVKYLFAMQRAMERHADELAQANSENHGKTLAESQGDIQRAIENVECAIGVGYTLAKGDNQDQIASSIDEMMVKEPLGVFGIISPFNFPIMIPFWFIPYALVLGDTVVVKPSEITPVPMQRVVEIFHDEVGLPPGVLNMIHGGKDVVESIISHDLVRGVAFVGSTPVAKLVYRVAGEYGKRALVNGGAKNSIVVMPDAHIPNAISSIVSSFFGNAGQRCLAGSNLVTVGKVHHEAVQKFVTAASALKVGHALDKGTEMGPVVTAPAKQKIMEAIEEGAREGGELVLDGRHARVPDHPNGFYLNPTIMDNLSKDMRIVKQEIFGPVAGVIQVDDLDSAIDFVNSNTNYGNMASIFTSSGGAAREFRRRVDAGNIGINIGVAAPAANFPFGGRRDSFFGVLHAQIDTVDFFTDKKVIISKW